ncbi:MAG: helix-turn-helix transcriptional regulator [Planctomycetota bacterium]
MTTYRYNAEQWRLIEQAKSCGARRVIIPLTPEQSESERERIEDIELLVREELKHPSNPNPDEHVTRLREAREAAGMTMADVARAASMTRQAILEIESGRNSNPKIGTLRRIANAIGVELRIDIVTTGNTSA